MLARYMMSSCVRPSVCPPQTGVVSKPLVELVFGTDASFHHLPHTVYKEICLSPKIRVLPSGTLSQTPDLEIFFHGKSIALPTKLAVVVVVDGPVFDNT